MKPRLEEATFAAGCFWGVESAFMELDGVEDTQVGYTGGHTEKPTYEQVCSGTTGHAEAVRVRFNPNRVTYEELLDLFFSVHDPTQLNRQGPDVGSQYRSVIFFHTPQQEEDARDALDTRNATGKFKGRIVTKLESAGPFYPAEAYHQQYYAKQGRQGW